MYTTVTIARLLSSYQELIYDLIISLLSIPITIVVLHHERLIHVNIKNHYLY